MKRTARPSLLRFAYNRAWPCSVAQNPVNHHIETPNCRCHRVAAEPNHPKTATMASSSLWD